MPWNKYVTFGVYSGMPICVRWVSWIRAIGIGVLVLVAALGASVPIQQNFLRWRTERLLSDIRSLQVGRATNGDVQALIDRWHPWVSTGLPCSPEKCTYWFEVWDYPSLFLRSCPWNSCEPLRRPMQLLGWHTSYATGSVNVGEGIVTGTRFSLFVEVLPEGPGRSEHGYGLIGSVVESLRFDPYVYRAQRLLHPNYWIGKPSGCEGCIAVQTGLTPAVDRAKASELTGFNFSCITRWNQCTREADIMPAAWRQYERDLQSNEGREQAFEKCEIPLEFLGRESLDIAVIQVSDQFLLKEPRHIEKVIKLKDFHPLKGIKPEFLPSRNWLSVYDRGIGIPGHSALDITPGKKYIALGSLGNWGGGGNFMTIDDCGLIPFSRPNLAAIERGISSAPAAQAN